MRIVYLQMFVVVSPAKMVVIETVTVKKLNVVMMVNLRKVSVVAVVLVIAAVDQY